MNKSTLLVRSLRAMIFLVAVIFFFIVLASLTSCRFNTPKRVVERGFYFWKTDFNLSHAEVHWLDTLAVKKMYVRFFDVDWDFVGQAIPKGVCAVANNDLDSVKIIPTIFIVNRVFEHLKDSFEIKDLADKIVEKTKKIGYFKNSCIEEMQFDCDWTEGTKKNYFYFLEYLSHRFKVSATIRLWQIKYKDRAGVPPVDRGTLMVYNLSDPTKMNDKNSILEISELKKYLVSSEKYPLPLDVVLPVFSWGKLFRAGKFEGLVNDLTTEYMQHASSFKASGTHSYTCISDTVIGRYFLRPGDKIHVEEVDKKSISDAVELVCDHLNTDSLTVSFYHFDTTLLKHYGQNFLNETYDQLH